MPIYGGVDALVWVTGDHMAHSPPPAGEKLYTVDYTGKLLWTFPTEGEGCGDTMSTAIADGMIFHIDAYTNLMWAFGKGPSGVEVTVPKAEIAKGESIWIYGKVTDQSPAQKGTPCVSKEDMGPWMEYLHAGMPQPPYGMNGVSLTLYAESKTTGKSIELGTAMTSGDTGEFSFKWTPQDADLYKITGVFLGDESYWTSFGSTMLAVGPAVASATSGSTTAAMTITSVAAVVIGGIVIQKRGKNRREETEN
jgi:hypothetical protein